ncbi:tetratricopeptide repeat protein [Mucilaginibacter sp.]
MKITSKVAVAALGLVLAGSAVHAQSLDDAKKAISAEQYQKAKSMLKNLTVSQPTKDENFFYLGWVYLQQDEPDSAKLTFNKGLAANPKSALNLVGLGAVARLDKDQATATSDFNQALAISKKDSKPYVYIGKSYLLVPNGGTVAPADANAAIDVLNKGIAINAKDPDLFLTLGAAQLSQLKSTDAYGNFTTVQSLDPKSAAASVALGVISKYANNYDDAETNFKAAIAIDPNYGPAYREWAETDLRWANSEAKMAAKKQEAVEHYQKYLSLTDMSLESQMRYADFLISAKDPADYKILEQLATDMSKSASTNLRIYRYLAYAAYENKDYAAGLTALNTWMTKADPKRIIPADYLYLGRLQIASGNDSLGVQNLKKAYDLDSTQADVFQEIAKSNYTNKKYLEAANAYKEYIDKSHKATLNDYLSEALSFYKAYTTEYYSKAVPKPVADTSLLTKSDSAFSYIQHKATAPVAIVALYQAREQDFKEPDRTTSKGLAKPFYEQYIALTTAKGIKDGDKPFLAEAYDYLGRYYELAAKDDAKATEAYTNALANSPSDSEALDYMKRKGKK